MTRQLNFLLAGSVTDTCNTEDIQDQPDRTKSAPINIASSASNSQHGQTNLKDVASATVPTEPSEPTEPPIPTLSGNHDKQRALVPIKIPLCCKLTQLMFDAL